MAGVAGVIIHYFGRKLTSNESSVFDTKLFSQSVGRNPGWQRQGV